MAIFNLVFLVKMIEISVKLMSDQLIENKSKEKLNLLLWGSLKLLSIGVLFVFIYKYNEKSILPCLLCGIGTLFIVPLMGGAFWNFFWNDEVNEQGRV